MPELPEVETVTRGLKRLVVGKKIITETHDWPKSFPNDEESVRLFMIGAKIMSVDRRGKAMIINLSTKYSLVVHLKMTGQVVYSDKPGASRSDDLEEATKRTAKRTDEYSEASTGIADEVSTDSSFSVEGNSLQQEVASSGVWGGGHPNDSLLGGLPDKSTRVEITFSDKTKLFFNDQRKFGYMKLVPTLEAPDMPFFKKLGPEPLVDSFTSADFAKRMKRRSGTTVKAAILDQSVLAGVGNIYADEALFASRIHPAVRVKELTDSQLSTLLDEIKFVMNLSIDKGGSTNKNYIDAEGKKGSYMEFARVFRRDGKECDRDGTELLKARVAARGTHYCPTCQIAPSDFVHVSVRGDK